MRYFCILLFILFIRQNVLDCSGFYAKTENKILVGINVDWKVPASQIHFFPPVNKNYGYLNFNIKGYFNDSYGDCGGINGKGLFYEWTDNLYAPDFSFHVNGTINYDGYVMDLIMTTCTTVAEAEKLIRTYNLMPFSYTHLLLGDRYGNSLIVERADNSNLSFIRSGKNYQVITNFLVAWVEDPLMKDFVGCYRYEYIDNMLRDNKDISLDLYRTILDGAANKGQVDPTIISIIYDLNNLNAYVYTNSNYEEAYKFSLIEEINKGKRSLDLPPLYSGIKGIYPVSNELVSSSSINLSWYGNADNYEILVSTDSQLSDNMSFITRGNNYQQAGLNASFILLLMLSFILIRKNKKIGMIGCFILMLAGCDKGLVNLPETISSTKHSKPVDGLLPNKTYYWKIIAAGKNGFTTESKVYNFLTSDFK